jgi:hypothetical protein
MRLDNNYKCCINRTYIALQQADTVFPAFRSPYPDFHSRHPGLHRAHVQIKVAFAEARVSAQGITM